MITDPHVTDTRVDVRDLASTVSRLEMKVQQLLDHQSILYVYRRYTRGLNRYDLDLLNGSFWPDAQVNYGSRSHRSDEWIESWQKDRYLKGLASQAHHITNEFIEIEGDVAHAETYLLALWNPPEDDKPPAIIIGGRYIDRLDRRNGEWRIAVREFFPNFMITATSILNTRLAEVGWPGSKLGSCDKNDPSYHRPLSRRESRDDK